MRLTPNSARGAHIILNKNMVEQTELQKLKEEYLEFFKKTPPEVIDFVLSEETAKRITDICGRNRIGDEEKIESVAYRIALVFLGKLPRENLVLTLERGVGLTAETAKKVADEANQFISSAMTRLKSGGIVQPKKEMPEKKIIASSTEVSVGKEEKPKKPPPKDVYREPVE